MVPFAPISTRFAPSPTGGLHLGHAYAAWIAHDRARAAGGRFLVRMEDIDQTRCRPAFDAAIIEDLAWLGIMSDGPVRRQSAHFDDYRAALARLEALGVLYPCFCTRSEIAQAVGAPQGPAGPLYPGTCRHLTAAARGRRLAGGQDHALRLDIAGARRIVGPALCWHDEKAGRQEARPEELGDVVLARKETPASYHLAVTVDDALQGITLVTRGVDLFPATHVHRLLQALLDLPVPDYAHHGLVMGEDGIRLAKRDRALTLAAMRAAGESPADLRRRLGLAPG
ncbi:tRNA glutamyl-Q(34) synthetase GluQRS [Zavarzinia compransoris]|uniref:tRNA glutamyl-Q(34) synthetase GluQRS n=1 Tax=Zavarzinia compransoris TaxID=1264899 RepID=A0A317EA15_9PROT|nr:tRNA glutamyl-Q(34) synthetase GluQRS [Zavarzinia compransoris]PWR22143.1 tRNA glutamyl-Q(34) synthetase GluQRS [Zavarzinia compransoris]TDP47106.1 glutamyl-Q tRNA(Asp) synthetase [Zavarzinia compransoris]